MADLIARMSHREICKLTDAGNTILPFSQGGGEFDGCSYRPDVTP
ncbi:hypothetical protein [Celerinatantimonas sp. YJH-8]